VALIPARRGSTRLPGKNIRMLGGHPLIAYTIAAAFASEGVRGRGRLDGVAGDRRDRD